MFDTKLTLHAAFTVGTLLAVYSLSAAATADHSAVKASATKPAAKISVKPTAAAPKSAVSAKKPGANKPDMTPPPTAAKTQTATPLDTVKSLLQAQKTGDDIKAYSYFTSDSRQQKSLKDWLDQTHQVRQSFGAITLVAGEALLIASDYGSNYSPQNAKITPKQVKGDTAVVELTRLVPITSTLYLKKENGQWLVDIQKSLLGGNGGEKPSTSTSKSSSSVSKPLTPPSPPANVKPTVTTPPSPPDTAPQVLGNLRQIYSAFQVYALDHGGHFPDASKWTDELTPYLSNPGILKNPPDSPSVSGFAMNSSISGQLLSDVAKDRVLLYETSTSDKNVSGTGETLPSKPSHAGGYLLLTTGGDSKTATQKPSVR